MAGVIRAFEQPRQSFQQPRHRDFGTDRADALRPGRYEQLGCYSPGCSTRTYRFHRAVERYTEAAATSVSSRSRLAFSFVDSPALAARPPDRGEILARLRSRSNLSTMEFADPIALEVMFAERTGSHRGQQAVSRESPHFHPRPKP